MRGSTSEFDMNGTSSRWALPAIVVVAVIAAWAVMPGVDTGPDVDSLPERAAPPELTAGNEVVSGGQEQPSGWDDLGRAPSGPDEVGAGERGSPIAQPAGTRPSVQMGGGAMGDDKAAQLIARRAERVATRMTQTADKVAAMHNWSDRERADVQAAVDRASRELDAATAQLENGEIDVGQASTKINDVQEAAMREIEGIVGEKPGSDMRQQLGLVSEEEAWEAWEGIPFEEWAAQQEAGGDGW
jgi:hypothetical protein